MIKSTLGHSYHIPLPQLQVFVSSPKTAALTPAIITASQPAEKGGRSLKYTPFFEDVMEGFLLTVPSEYNQCFHL